MPRDISHIDCAGLTALSTAGTWPCRTARRIRQRPWKAPRSRAHSTLPANCPLDRTEAQWYDSNKRMNDSKHKRPTRDAETTRVRLLDAAEALFADNGYNAVSMRDIARHAKVNLAAAGYHFGSKENLFTESLMRQMRPLNERRLAALEKLELRTRAPALAEVLDTFARVMIEQAVSDQESGRRLHRALSRIFAESDEIAHAVFRKEMLPAAMRFLAAIRRACPELPVPLAGMGLALYAGCVIHTLRWAVSPPFPELRGDVKPDVETLMTSLVAFGVAGIKRLTAAEKKKAKGLTP